VDRDIEIDFVGHLGIRVAVRQGAQETQEHLSRASGLNGATVAVLRRYLSKLRTLAVQMT
jgi:hypothetical protein